MATTTTKKHILVMPYPAQGHMIPVLDLTHHLAATGCMSITVLITPNNLAQLTPLISANPNITPLVLPFPPTPDIPAGVENSKGLPLLSVLAFVPALSRLEDPLRRWFDSHPSPPVAIISDLFCGWTQRFADKVGIKNVVFSNTGAMSLSIIYAHWTNKPKNEGGDENRHVSFPHLPDCPTFPWWQLSTVYRSYVEGNADSDAFDDVFKADMDSWGVVLNTFDEERVYLDHLMSFLGHDRVWAVGPLLRPHGVQDRGGSSSVDADIILPWLDKCRDGEVVYVSFGSQAVLSARQMEVLAQALDESGVRFIWSARDLMGTQQVGGEVGVVPPGFEDRIGDRGMIIKGWAPQVTILRHRAVGTFLTHCGWNSALEALMAGVALLVWPMGADQFYNAKVLVEQFKVGVRICEGEQNDPDPRELAWVLANSVKGDLFDRHLIKKLQHNTLKAVSESGTSSKNLEKLVQKLSELNTTKA